MRKLFVSNVMSLDGFFETPERKLDWCVADEEFFSYARAMLRSMDTILFGRRTYQHMAAYWPTAPKDEIAEKMNNLRKIVFSRTLAKAEWNNSTLVSGDIAGEVRRLKQQAGKDMVILGSAMLASFLLQQGQIDEYRVIVNPVLLGRGNSLFPDIKQPVTMKLNETKLFGSGVAVLYYQKV